MNIKRLDRTKIITSSFKSYLNSFPSILTYEPVLESTRLFLNKLIFTLSLHRKKRKRFSNSHHLGTSSQAMLAWRERKERRGWIDEGWILNEARALTGTIIETPGSDLNRADWFHSPHRIWQRSSGWRGASLPSSLPPCTYVATRWYIGGGRVSPIPWTGRKASPSKRYPPSWEEHAFRDVNWNVPTKPPPPPQRRWKICVRDNRMEGLARGWRDVGVTWIGSIGGSFAWRGIFDQPLEGVGYVGTR